MSQLVARLRETLESSTSSSQRPTLTQRRRSSSVPPLRSRDAHGTTHDGATPPMPIYGGDALPGRRRRRESESEGTDIAFSPVQPEAQSGSSPAGILQRPRASPPPAPSAGSAGAGAFSGPRKNRAMSLTLCVDELDLKRGKRASASSGSGASSLSPTGSYSQAGDNPPVPKAGAPVEAMGGNGASSFGTGRPLSFAKQQQQQAHGKRRRLGDPM